VKGTHAHSWVMSFASEIDAFRTYADIFPETCLLLVDTYDTLKSGVPNAIKVFEELKEKGHEPVGIRLDSGDLAYLSKKARLMLDKAGFPEVKIFASSDIDEWLIRDMKLQGAKIDVWGVGTKLITSEGCPALGGVYKLSAEISDGEILPKLKVSDNVEKITNPGYKKLTRLYDKVSGKAIADLIMLDVESIDESIPLTIFHPVDTWKRMRLTGFRTKDLMAPVFDNGQQVYRSPALMDIQAYAREDLNTFWDEIKRLINPQEYKVDLSLKLYELKKSLLEQWSI
jgi:nicotinate phosphoribosyltransferase